MTKAQALRTVVLGAAIAVLPIFPVALGASAATATPFTNAAPAASGCSTVPRSGIFTQTTSGLAFYHPNSLSVKVSTTLSLCITNKTTATQTVTVQGSNLVTIAAGKTAGILCNFANQSTFSLVSNPRAKLAVTCTA